MRKLLGIVAGIAVAMIVIMIVEMVGHSAQPIPETIDLSDREAMAALVADTPFWLKLLVVVGYGAGTLAGAWTALKIGGWIAAAWIIGALFAIAGVASVLQFPHPMWMQIGSLLAPLLGAWAAIHVPGWRPRVAV